MNVLFVGGPNDGWWTYFPRDEVPEFYEAPVLLKWESAPDLSNMATMTMPIAKRVVYRRHLFRDDDEAEYYVYMPFDQPHPVRALLTGYRGPTVAYLHTMHMEHGQKHEILSMDEHSPFGLPGRDHDPSYTVTCEPLHKGQKL